MLLAMSVIVRGGRPVALSEQQDAQIVFALEVARLPRQQRWSRRPLLLGGTNLSTEGAISMWLGDDLHIQTMLGANYREIGAGVAESDGFGPWL